MKGGKQKLLYEGYLYIKQKNIASGMVSYGCDERQNAHECKAKVKVLAGEIVGWANQHAHPPDSHFLADVRGQSQGRSRRQAVL